VAAPVAPSFPLLPEYSPRSRPQEPFSDSIHDEDGHLVRISAHSLSYLPDRHAFAPHLFYLRNLRPLAPDEVGIFQGYIDLKAILHLCPTSRAEGGGHY